MKKIENLYSDAELMKRVLTGEADEADRKELDKRLSECPGLRKVYEELQDEERLDSAFEAYQRYSSKKAYQAFLHRIGRMETKARKLRPLRNGWYAAAAVAALFIALSFYLLNYVSPETEQRALILPGTQQAQLTLSDGNVIDVRQKEVSVVVDGVQVKYKNGTLSYLPTEATPQEAANAEEEDGTEEPSPKSNELAIPRGGENTVILADGTTVHLNAGSKLVYPVRFAGKRRIVRLEGEAYFDVKADKKHPFVVQTHLGEVTVLGTAFNVNAYADSPVCYTTLVNGKVEFAAPGAETLTLLPGEQAVVSAHSSTKRKVDLEEYVGWVEGMYVFNDSPLGEIMKTFERWYDIQVYYETPALRDIAYSGSLKRYGTVNTFLDALELTGDLTYKINGKNILIYNRTESPEQEQND